MISYRRLVFLDDDFGLKIADSGFKWASIREEIEAKLSMYPMSKDEVNYERD